MLPQVLLRSASRVSPFRAKLWVFSGIVGAAWPAHARAAELHYQAPDECPAVENVKEEVERLLGSPLADAAPIEVTVTITNTPPDDWRVVVRVKDADVTEPRVRELTGHSCADVADAAAVATAIAMRSRDAEPSPNPEPAGAAKPPSTATTTPTKPAPKPTKTREFQANGRKPQLGIGASFLLDTSALPSLAAGLEAAALADWKTPGIRLMMFGGLLARQQENLSTGHGGKFDLLFAGAAACGVKALESISASVCAGAEAGALRGEGLVSAPRLGSSPWVAPRVDVGLALPLGRGFSLVARAGAAFPLIRKSFVVDGDQLLHRPGTPTGRFSAGLELAL